jgi:hypothetical protein
VGDLQEDRVGFPEMSLFDLEIEGRGLLEERAINIFAVVDISGSKTATGWSIKVRGGEDNIGG